MEIRTKLDNGLLQTYVNMDIFKNKTLASIRKMLQLDIPFDFYFIYRDTICGIHQEHRRKLVHDATVLYVLRKSEKVREKKTKIVKRKYSKLVNIKFIFENGKSIVLKMDLNMKLIQILPILTEFMNDATLEIDGFKVGNKTKLTRFDKNLNYYKIENDTQLIISTKRAHSIQLLHHSIVIRCSFRVHVKHNHSRIKIIRPAHFQELPFRSHWYVQVLGHLWIVNECYQIVKMENANTMIIQPAYRGISCYREIVYRVVPNEKDQRLLWEYKSTDSIVKRLLVEKEYIDLPHVYRYFKTNITKNTLVQIVRDIKQVGYPNVEDYFRLMRIDNVLNIHFEYVAGLYPESNGTISLRKFVNYCTVLYAQQVYTQFTTNRNAMNKVEFKKAIEEVAKVELFKFKYAPYRMHYYLFNHIQIPERLYLKLWMYAMKSALRDTARQFGAVVLIQKYARRFMTTAFSLVKLNAVILQAYWRGTLERMHTKHFKLCRTCAQQQTMQYIQNAICTTKQYILEHIHEIRQKKQNSILAKWTKTMVKWTNKRIVQFNKALLIIQRWTRKLLFQRRVFLKTLKNTRDNDRIAIAKREIQRFNSRQRKAQILNICARRTGHHWTIVYLRRVLGSSMSVLLTIYYPSSCIQYSYILSPYHIEKLIGFQSLDLNLIAKELDARYEQYITQSALHTIPCLKLNAVKQIGIRLYRRIQKMNQILFIVEGFITTTDHVTLQLYNPRNSQLVSSTKHINVLHRDMPNDCHLQRNPSKRNKFFHQVQFFQHLVRNTRIAGKHLRTKKQDMDIRNACATDIQRIFKAHRTRQCLHHFISDRIVQVLPDTDESYYINIKHGHTFTRKPQFWKSFQIKQKQPNWYHSWCKVIDAQHTRIMYIQDYSGRVSYISNTIAAIRVQQFFKTNTLHNNKTTNCIAPLSIVERKKLEKKNTHRTNCALKIQRAYRNFELRQLLPGLSVQNVVEGITFPFKANSYNEKSQDFNALVIMAISKHFFESDMEGAKLLYEEALTHRADDAILLYGYATLLNSLNLIGNTDTRRKANHYLRLSFSIDQNRISLHYFQCSIVLAALCQNVNSKIKLRTGGIAFQYILGNFKQAKTYYNKILHDGSRVSIFLEELKIANKCGVLTRIKHFALGSVSVKEATAAKIIQRVFRHRWRSNSFCANLGLLLSFSEMKNFAKKRYEARRDNLNSMLNYGFALLTAKYDYTKAQQMFATTWKMYPNSIIASYGYIFAMLMSIYPNKGCLNSNTRCVIYKVLRGSKISDSTAHNLLVVEKVFFVAPLCVNPKSALALCHYALFQQFVRQNFDAAEKLYEAAFQNAHRQEIGVITMNFEEFMHSRNPSGLLNGIGPCISSKYNGVVEVVRTPWWKMRDPLHTRISFWYNTSTGRSLWQAPGQQTNRISTTGWDEKFFQRYFGACTIQKIFRFWQGTRFFLLRNKNTLSRAIQFSRHTELQYQHNPNKVSSVVNYGLYLHYVKNDFTAAEKMYKKAFMLESKNDITAFAYACLILAMELRQRDLVVSRAKQLFEYSCTQTRAKSKNQLELLKIVEQCFIRFAILLNPKNPIAILNYAIFNQFVLKQYYRAEMAYLEALQLSTKINIVQNYEEFCDGRWYHELFQGEGPMLITHAKAKQVDVQGDWISMRASKERNVYSYWYNSNSGKLSWKVPTTVKQSMNLTPTHAASIIQQSWKHYVSNFRLTCPLIRSALRVASFSQEMFDINAHDRNTMLTFAIHQHAFKHDYPSALKLYDKLLEETPNDSLLQTLRSCAALTTYTMHTSSTISKDCVEKYLGIQTLHSSKGCFEINQVLECSSFIFACMQDNSNPLNLLNLATLLLLAHHKFDTAWRILRNRTEKFDGLPMLLHYVEQMRRPGNLFQSLGPMPAIRKRSQIAFKFESMPRIVRCIDPEATSEDVKFFWLDNITGFGHWHLGDLPRYQRFLLQNTPIKLLGKHERCIKIQRAMRKKLCFNPKISLSETLLCIQLRQNISQKYLQDPQNLQLLIAMGFQKMSVEKNFKDALALFKSGLVSNEKNPILLRGWALAIVIDSNNINNAQAVKAFKHADRLDPVKQGFHTYYKAFFLYNVAIDSHNAYFCLCYAIIECMVYNRYVKGFGVLLRALSYSKSSDRLLHIKIQKICTTMIFNTKTGASFSNVCPGEAMRKRSVVTGTLKEWKQMYDCVTKASFWYNTNTCRFAWELRDLTKRPEIDASNMLKRLWKRKVCNTMRMRSVATIASAIMTHRNAVVRFHENPENAENMLHFALLNQLFLHKVEEAGMLFAKAYRMFSKDPCILRCFGIYKLSTVINYREVAIREAFSMFHTANELDPMADQFLKIYYCFYSWATVRYHQDHYCWLSIALVDQYIFHDHHTGMRALKTAFGLNPTNDKILLNYQELEQNLFPGEALSRIGPTEQMRRNSELIQQDGEFWMLYHDPYASQAYLSYFWFNTQTTLSYWWKPSIFKFSKPNSTSSKELAACLLIQKKVRKWSRRFYRVDLFIGALAIGFHANVFEKYIRNRTNTTNILRLALYRHVIENDFEKSKELYKEALALNPSNALIQICYALFMVNTCDSPQMNHPSWVQGMETIQKVRVDTTSMEELFFNIDLCFYRWAMLSNATSLCTRMYASVFQFIYEDYNRAEYFYLEAIRRNPKDQDTQMHYTAYMNERRPGRRFGGTGPGEHILCKSTILDQDASWKYMQYDHDNTSFTYWYNLVTLKSYWEKPKSFSTLNLSKLRFNRIIQTREKLEGKYATYIARAYRRHLAKVHGWSNADAPCLDSIFRSRQYEKYAARKFHADTKSGPSAFNYALFLHTIVHNFSRAHDLYVHALKYLEGIPRSIALSCLGILLLLEARPSDLGHVADAELLFEKSSTLCQDKKTFATAWQCFFSYAMLTNPENVYSLCNAALVQGYLFHNFQKTIFLFQKALAIEPQNQILQKCYGDFLIQFYDRIAYTTGPGERVRKTSTTLQYNGRFIRMKSKQQSEPQLAQFYYDRHRGITTWLDPRDYQKY